MCHSNLRSDGGNRTSNLTCQLLSPAHYHMGYQAACRYTSAYLGNWVIMFAKCMGPSPALLGQHVLAVQGGTSPTVMQLAMVSSKLKTCFASITACITVANKVGQQGDTVHASSHFLSAHCGGRAMLYALLLLLGQLCSLSCAQLLLQCVPSLLDVCFQLQLAACEALNACMCSSELLQHHILQPCRAHHCFYASTHPPIADYCVMEEASFFPCDHNYWAERYDGAAGHPAACRVHAC